MTETQSSLGTNVAPEVRTYATSGWTFSYEYPMIRRSFSSIAFASEGVGGQACEPPGVRAARARAVSSSPVQYPASSRYDGSVVLSVTFASENASLWRWTFGPNRSSGVREAYVFSNSELERILFYLYLFLNL